MYKQTEISNWKFNHWEQINSQTALWEESFVPIGYLFQALWICFIAAGVPIWVCLLFSMIHFGCSFMKGLHKGSLNFKTISHLLSYVVSQFVIMLQRQPVPVGSIWTKLHWGIFNPLSRNDFRTDFRQCSFTRRVLPVMCPKDSARFSHLNLASDKRYLEILLKIMKILLY